jgi:hypothetical protein
LRADVVGEDELGHRSSIKKPPEGGIVAKRGD